MASNAAVPAGAAKPVISQEFIVRIPKATKRKHHVMRFLQSRQQTISEWSQVRMERENNQREFRNDADEMPKHGAGSEYGRDMKEEARRKKYGIVRKKYNPDDQPWLLNVGGKHGKKFRGVREGGVMANASYYVFSKAPDGVFEAYPVDEWYNFTPVQRFKALTAEEAEDAYSKRDKIINHFAIMVNKRIAEAQGQTVEEEKDKDEKKSSKKSRASLKLSDMDDWVGDSDFSAGSDEGEEKEDPDKKKKKRKNEKKKDKKSQESDSSAKEESDEGDFDDREVDYITSGSDSSDEGPEDAKNKNQMKGVEDEDALRQLVLSEEEEEEDEKKDEEEKKNEEEEKNNATKEGGANKDEKEKKAKSSDESSSESSDSDLDDQVGNCALFMPGKKKEGNGSRSNTPTRDVNSKKSKTPGGKRKKEGTPTKDGTQNAGAAAGSQETPNPKKPKIELNLGGSVTNTPTASNTAAHSSQQNTPLSQIDGINEEAVRRYLMRKPMTASELLQKFKSKKTGLSSDQLVNTIAQILKRLNPEKQRIKNKLYLSIKQ